MLDRSGPVACYRPRQATVKRRRLILFIAAATVVVGLFLFKHLYPTSRLRLPAGTTTPQLSLGFAHGVVIAPDGTLWSWGAEDLGWPVLGYGQTNGAPAFSPVLRRISPATNWVRVSAGQDHNLALKSDGTIWTWGSNHRGQMGAGTVGMALQSSVVPSVPGTDWVEVVAASVCSYALKKDGSLWAWGLNNFCQLGIGTSIDSPIPVQVGSSTNWMRIRAGGVSAAGIQSDGSLWIWGGSPEFGNSSRGLSNNVAFPKRVTMETNWVDVAVDYNIWLAVKSDGTLWAFGQNAHGYTGAPRSSFAIPKQIGTDTNWISVSSSRYGNLMRQRDGSFWKLSEESEFTPRPPSAAGSALLQRLDLPKEAVAVDIAGGATAAVTLDGKVWAHGVVLGERTAKDRILQTIARFGSKISWLRDLGTRTENVYRDKPWPVRNIEPDEPAK